MNNNYNIDPTAQIFNGASTSITGIGGNERVRAAAQHIMGVPPAPGHTATHGKSNTGWAI